MGLPPPPDAPDVPTQQAAGVGVGFKPTVPGASLCGFGIPGFALSVTLPSIPFPPKGWPPALNLMLALNCDLDNPIDGNIGFGGGRVASPPVDADNIDK